MSSFRAFRPGTVWSVTLLSCSLWGVACGSDDEASDFDDATPDAGGGGTDEASGGSSSGGASSDGDAGGSGGGDTNPGDDEFAGLLVLTNEYEDSVENYTLDVQAAFIAPGGDIAPLEANWDDYLAGLAELEPGACGPRPSAPDPTFEPVAVGGATLASATASVALGDVFDGVLTGFAEMEDVVPLLGTPLDFSITGGAAAAAASAEAWGSIPTFTLNDGYTCPAVDGCTITPSATDADDLLIEFSTSAGVMLCRSGTQGQSVTIPPDLLDQETGGVLYVFHFHDVQLGTSPLRVVVESRLEPVPLFGSEPL